MRESQSESIEVADVIEELDALEETVSDDVERAGVQRVRRMVERVPGSEQIHKYTSRDVGEAFVGALIFSLPLLVEDGVFDIAAWFATTVGPVPPFLLANVLVVLAITAGLLYAIDIRDVRIHRPILGVMPRRLVGILGISAACSVGMMLLWGRLHAGDPSPLEALARVTVVWSAAALGAVLADILPGESEGADLIGLFDDPD